MRPRTPLVAALAVILAGQPAHASETSENVPPPGVAEVHRVTLVTGDVAELETRPDGTERARPASGAGVGYHAFVSEGDAYLVPAAAQPLVGHGRLDLELFNVSDLVEQGYDDAHTDRIPLIIGYGAGQTALATRQTPAGSVKGAVLGSADALAVETVKKDARRFWESVARGSAPVAGGVDKIWLDAKVHASLDQSAAQIGAPAAWSRGLTGKDTRIAVLDTGIDDTHPDFAGRITATRDFTGTGTVDDVPGTARTSRRSRPAPARPRTGSTAVSRPDASLLIGKVLDDTGRGSSSDIIAGMEWAAANGADVVNLSLGGPATRGRRPAEPGGRPARRTVRRVVRRCRRQPRPLGAGDAVRHHARCGVVGPDRGRDPWCRTDVRQLAPRPDGRRRDQTGDRRARIRHHGGRFVVRGPSAVRECHAVRRWRRRTSPARRRSSSSSTRTGARTNCGTRSPRPPRRWSPRTCRSAAPDGRTWTGPPRSRSPLTPEPCTWGT